MPITIRFGRRERPERQRENERSPSPVRSEHTSDMFATTGPGRTLYMRRPMAEYVHQVEDTGFQRGYTAGWLAGYEAAQGRPLPLGWRLISLRSLFDGTAWRDRTTSPTRPVNQDVDLIRLTADWESQSELARLDADLEEENQDDEHVPAGEEHDDSEDQALAEEEHDDSANDEPTGEEHDDPPPIYERHASPDEAARTNSAV